jgi:membrane protease YdiL (CAAX protease family)
VDEVTQTGTPEFEALPQKRGAQWIFIGENGLRAGWSVLIFIAIFSALEMLYGVTVGHFFRSHMDMNAPLGPGIAILQEAVQLLLVLVATVIMTQIERRKIVVYGYSGSARFSRFVYGLLWGIIAISVLVGTLWKAHLLAFDGSPLSGLSAWKYAAAWAFFFLIVGLLEESLLRGYLQYTLTRGIGFWWSALLLSALFGLVHKGNVGESPVGLFSAGAVGLVFCLSLWYTGSLWWAIGFHAAWDWGQTYVYGTSDSGMMAKGHFLSGHPTGPLLWTGGATGPEGSLWIVPLLLIMPLLMWLWWGRRAVAPLKQAPAAIAES